MLKCVYNIDSGVALIHKKLNERPSTRLYQCDQIGLFLKGLGDKFSYKSCSCTSQLDGLLLKIVLFKYKLLW